MKINLWLLLLPVFAALVLQCTQARAGSGYTLRSQSASTLGSAQAGMTAGAEDVSTLAFNAASIAYGGGWQLVVVGTGILSTGQFDPDVATTVLGTPIQGNNGGNSGTAVLLPSLYGAADLGRDVRVGLGVTSTYGLGSYWSEGWVGRYYALNSQLTTVDILPVVSWRPHPTISLGAGLDIQYAEVKTTSAIDFGTIDQLTTGGLFGGIPAGSDGKVQTKATAWSAGFRLGAIFEPREGTRVGVSLHSPMTPTLSGTAGFTNGSVGGAVSVVSGTFMGTDIRQQLRMPATILIGGDQRLTEQWSIRADLQWMAWGALHDFTTTYGNPAQPTTSVALNWHNSVFVTVGAKYQVNPDLAIRFGAAYDQTPTSRDDRVPAIPNLNSVWAAAGAQYRLSKTTTVDVAYGHVFSFSGQIDQSALAAGNLFRGNLSGKLSGTVDYLAAQLGVTF